MNILGIELTPGHLIFASVLVVSYDAIWTFLFSNLQSKWWFERVQGLLKVGIYTGFIGIIVLVAYTPWPYNLVLVLSVAASIASIAYWLRHRTH
jgi:hypothetical protein